MDVDDVSSESDEQSIDLSEELTKVCEYRSKIKSNPDDYDSHCNLIKSLKLCSDENDVRNARESMHAVFPLTSSMWLEWIEEDKQQIINENGDKSLILQLFRRAIEDYRNVEVWMEYCQFSIGFFEDKNEIRQVFEEALSQVGTQFKEGSLIWAIFLIYEKDVILASLEGEEAKQQSERVYKLFLRQLSLALEGNKEVYDEFLNWNKQWKFPEDEINDKYKQSSTITEFLKPYENHLGNADVDYESQKTKAEQKSKEEMWLEYLTFAEENMGKVMDGKTKVFNSKVDIINLYERSIDDICLSQAIWSRYIRYLSKNFANDQDRILSTCKRAIRNNKSSLELRLFLARNMERFSSPVEEIRLIFSNAIRASLSDPNPFLPLWQAYLDFERRQISLNSNGDLSVIRKLFEQLVAIGNYLDYDPSCVLIKYWALIEARHGNNVVKARELWAMVIKSLGSNSTALWLENLEFERRFGDFESCKRLMSNAVNCITDYPEYLFEKVLRCVAEDSDIESYLLFMKKIEMQQTKINEKRLKEAEMKKADNTEKTLKRPYEEKKTSKPQAKKVKIIDNIQESYTKVSSTVEKRNPAIHADERCVFVSNLKFEVTENELREMFSKSGELEDIRLSKNEKGESKGYAFIQYKEKSSVEEALKLEHAILMERPMYVSRSDPKNRHSFNYTVGKTETNKLFLKNLPKSTTKKELEEIYGKYGSLKAVRLVTFKNGISRGIAYVEFFDDNTASKALVGTDKMVIRDKIVEVSLSNTPQKNAARSDDVTASKPNTFLVPRAVHKPAPSTQKKQIHQSSVISTASDVPPAKKSNEDFRKFL